MANSVINEVRMTGDGDRIKELLHTVKKDSTGPGSMDFNKIKPMPNHLRGTNEGEEWERENWQSKWNANNDWATFHDSIDFLIFETPWVGVPGLIMQLAFQFPDIEFEYKFADEELGKNIGHYKFIGNGVFDLLAKEGIKEHTEEGIKFAARMWGMEELLD